MFFKNKNLFVILLVLIISILFIGKYFPVFEGYTADCDEMTSLYYSNGIAIYGNDDATGYPFNKDGYIVLGCNPDGSLKLGDRAINAISTNNNTTAVPQTSSSEIQTFPF